MKVVGVILAMIVVAFAVNILMGGGEVTKAHFDERINEINARIDSVRADVAKVWNVSRKHGKRTGQHHQVTIYLIHHSYNHIQLDKGANIRKKTVSLFSVCRNS